MIRNLLCMTVLLCFFYQVSAQYVSTPKDVDTRTLNTSYQVGAIAGSLTASPNGNSNYHVRIETPPGVNGLVPNLSVNYNSRSTNGLLGFGVSLTGISIISRGSNSQMQDGNCKKIDFTTTDALYLGGNRLILVSGTYGAANSEYRLDNSNKVRINLYGSGTSIYFKVWMSNGRTYLYGTDSNSRLSSGSGILRWYVKSISDYDGNSISYSYTNDTYGFRINQITYAGNTIDFEYSSRDDKTSQYFAGIEIKQHKILSKIKVNGQGSRFREYQFSYCKDIYSYMNEINVLGTDGTQVNSTVLNWGKSNNHSKYSTSVSKTTHIRQYGDFNGDGRKDFIQYPNKSSYATGDVYEVYLTSNDGKSETKIKTGSLGAYSKGIHILDYNGDFKDDILLTVSNFLGYSYTYWGYNNGTIEVLKSGDDEILDNGDNEFICADLNGDNSKDMIVLEWQIKSWILKRIDGVQASDFPAISSTTNEFSAHKFNNNNSEDIFVKSGDNLSVYELDPTDSKFKCLYSASIFNGSTDYEYVDFNGDGITDLYDKTNNKIHYGTGVGFTQITAPVIWTNSPLIEKYRKVLTGDFNGDGLTDIYQVSIVVDNFSYESPNYSIVKIHYGTGGLGFISEYRNDLSPLPDYPSTPYISSLEYISMQDLNGDNIDDVIFSHSNVSTFQKILSDDSGHETFLTKIADGMNNKYSISYQRTNDGDVYSQDGSTGDANLYYYQGKLKMVKGITMTSDGNTISNTSYKYKNQTIHRNYGFLGCKEYTQSESVQNSESTSVFEFVGSYYVPALKSTSSKLSGSLVSSASFTNNVAKVNGSKGFSLISYLTAQSQTDHVRGITNTVSYSGFDTYYNPASISKNLGGALTESQTFIYNNLVNSSYWLPGRPSDIVVTQDHTDNSSISTTTKMVYANHQLTQKTQLYGTPKAVTETYAYSSGRVSVVTVSGAGVESRATTFSYDGTGRFVIQEVNPLGHVTKATYDPVTGNQLTATDANNRVTSFTYNGFGQLLNTNYPDGTSNMNTISWNSSVTGSVYKASSTLSGNAPSSSYFDRLGRVIRSEGAGYNSETIKTDTRYDSKGRIAGVSLPFSSTKTAEKTFAYDTYGRPSATTLPNGRGSVTYTYNGLTTKVTNPESWKETSIDGAGFVKSVKDPGGQITYDYYSNGLVENIKFGQNVIHHVYDQQGNVIQSTDPDAGTTSAVYDAFGQVTSSTTANNHTYTYAYDKLGRITTRTLQSGGETTQWQYDPSGSIGAINQILLN